MVGQEQLKERIKELIENNTLPHFMILTGDKGSGKKLLANEIAAKVAGNVIQLESTSIDSIRIMIKEAYFNHDACYIIPDADGMSVAAKNAILKVTEEPPNNVYFIMTLEDINNTLPTIKSRGAVFQMDLYTSENLESYIQDNYKISGEEKSMVLSICDTPGEINEMIGNNAAQFHDYVDLVLDNITEVSGANAFKIPSKVALKDTEDGYDLKLFWKLFVKHSFERALQSAGIEKLRHLKNVGITSRYIQSLRTKSINRQMLMDGWILDIRREALDGSE